MRLRSDPRYLQVTTQGLERLCAAGVVAHYWIPVRPTVGRLNAKAPAQSCHGTGQRLKSLKTLPPESPEADSSSELLAVSKASWWESSRYGWSPTKRYKSGRTPTQ